MSQIFQLHDGMSARERLTVESVSADSCLQIECGTGWDGENESALLTASEVARLAIALLEWIAVTDALPLGASIDALDASKLARSAMARLGA